MSFGGRALSALLFTAACGEHRPPDPSTASILPPGVAARVGNESISTETVVRVSERQVVTARIALTQALFDALLAQGARAALAPDMTGGLERAAAARSLLEQFNREAAKAGAPGEQELSDIVHERWTELDRPDAVRTTHAVVLNAKRERDAAAHALADKLVLVLGASTTSAALIQLAKAFPAEGFEVRAETLPFVTADGRTLDRRGAGFVAGPGSFDRDFARAANQLESTGQLSPVTKSSFGYHVIRLDERAPGHLVPKADLPRLLGPDVVSRRAGRTRRELLDKLRQATPAQIERALDDLTAQIKVAP